ncbi:DUF4189 domain-containing protein [Streptomyces sp. AV19]|uniref:DUF4189 domain-containing protein n=1 Tax=Streptomyces sp. AV19 TaxID=2793068 RepID=UPI0018FE774B|nr:DUF4189 domain-containing protein [Streptomyces sp. AV19]MBH1938149.1 DUF4189 domain-containing protein [Streptomyces sp. AV19]MDG4534788.1 DUF4189 domain-containing protein [Streptomyces sp. AV19]
MSPPPVDHASLVLDRRLGQGGQGAVHRVTDRRINEADGGRRDGVERPRRTSGRAAPGRRASAVVAFAVVPSGGSRPRSGAPPMDHVPATPDAVLQGPRRCPRRGGRPVSRRVPRARERLVRRRVRCPSPTSYSATPGPPGRTYEEPAAPEPSDDDTPASDPAPPPPPPPRPDYYGAIAVGYNGGYGSSWDYGSVNAADRAALNRCSDTGCRVLTRFVNSCGAVAYNPGTRYYWGGQGATESEAKRDAISRAGGGRWIAYACTTRYRSP